MSVRNGPEVVLGRRRRFEIGASPRPRHSSNVGAAAVSQLDVHPARASAGEGASRPSSRHWKRIMDLIVSVTLLFVLAPILLLIALIILMDSPGSPLFSQDRLGRHGRHFRIVKFRSMRVDAESELNRVLATDVAARSEWDAERKLREDPRVTRIGRFLRATSVDELPQLINVALGHMSLVGPRPIVEDESGKYGDSIKTYYSVLPGMTGLWQVSGRNDLAYEDRIRCDVNYATHVSLLLDLRILARTLPSVIARRGAR